MSRQFGLTGSTTVGGNQPPSPHHRADTQREPIQSAGVTPRRPDSRRLNAAAPFTHLKRGRIAQAVIDVIAVFVTILFLMSVALSIPLAVFLMIFAA